MCEDNLLGALVLQALCVLDRQFYFCLSTVHWLVVKTFISAGETLCLKPPSIIRITVNNENIVSGSKSQAIFTIDVFIIELYSM